MKNPRARGRRARTAALAGLALLATAAAPALATTGPTAEIASGELFLGTTKVEAGARANGSFGSDNAAPAGYNPLTQTGTILGFRVNPAECAWTDGGCVTLGDFFTPGTPYEAWGVQVGSGTPGFNSNGGTGVAGTFTSVDSAGVTGAWQSSGTVDGIRVRQTYAIPAYAWMIDTTVELTNTTGATVDDVYFMRGLDPDNCRMETRSLCDSSGDGTADTSGTGGSVYKTHNAIVSQGSATTSALVTATQTNDSYLGLRATGAEARAFVKNSSFSNPASIENLWAGTDGAYRSTIASSFGDTGIYAVVRVPSIAAGATATVHVQYVVKEIPAAADFAETVASSGGLIDVAARNGGTALGGICAAPAHGTAVVEAGRVRYTPAAGFSGTDTFTYSTGGPCGTVTVTVPAGAAAAPAPATVSPFVVLTAPATRATLASGDLRIAQTLRIERAGRYTFIYTDPATGKRVRQLPGSTVGSRKLGKRYSAPVLTTTKPVTRVTLVSIFGRALPAKLKGRMTLRVVLKGADGTLSDVTP